MEGSCISLSPQQCAWSSNGSFGGTASLWRPSHPTRMVQLGAQGLCQDGPGLGLGNSTFEGFYSGQALDNFHGKFCCDATFS